MCNICGVDIALSFHSSAAALVTLFPSVKVAPERALSRQMNEHNTTIKSITPHLRNNLPFAHLIVLIHELNNQDAIDNPPKFGTVDLFPN